MHSHELQLTLETNKFADNDALVKEAVFERHRGVATNLIRCERGEKLICCWHLGEQSFVPGVSLQGRGQVPPALAAQPLEAALAFPLSFVLVNSGTRCIDMPCRPHSPVTLMLPHICIFWQFRGGTWCPIVPPAPSCPKSQICLHMDSVLADPTWGPAGCGAVMSERAGAAPLSRTSRMLGEQPRVCPAGCGGVSMELEPAACRQV